MSDRPVLPRTVSDWLCVFGPGAIIASLTIGTGELIFSTRGGAVFGYRILFVFVVILIMKWGLVVSTSRHMILTGVHPYERMAEIPGPRGWLPVMLLLMATVCLPVWISFHAGVIGNLTAWVTGTRELFHGGIDYLWGLVFLLATVTLSATTGYSVLERVQMFVVTAMILCSLLTLFLYGPDWVELALGIVPRPLSYPVWLPEKYPDIAQHSVWIETTRYVGVIGGAGFDYLAYTTWLREKGWGILPGTATPQQLEEIAADPRHEVRRWIRAPMIDCAISFLLIAAFTAVFVTSGALILRPEELVPDEDSLLNLQARFVTNIHPLLLPLYVGGAFLTMLGTLYATIEIACCIAEEILRGLVREWSDTRTRRLRRSVLAWCGSGAVLILMWLFVRQKVPVDVPVGVPSPVAVSPAASNSNSTSNDATVTATSSAGHELQQPPGQSPDVSTAQRIETLRREKPRVLLAILTPVNLFTGVLSCGLICVLVIWMDRRWLPAGLQPSRWLTALNSVSAIVLIAVGLKGYWDNSNRLFVLGSMGVIVIASFAVAAFAGRRLLPTGTDTSGEGDRS